MVRRWSNSRTASSGFWKSLKAAGENDGPQMVVGWWPPLNGAPSMPLTTAAKTKRRTNNMCELPSVYGCDRPTARKDHKCCECRGTILAGEKYHKHHGIWDGSASTFKVCEDCESLRAEVDKDERDPEWLTAFGNLYESVFESREISLIKRYLDIKRKRGSTIQPWMTERDAEMSNGEASGRKQSTPPT